MNIKNFFTLLLFIFSINIYSSNDNKKSLEIISDTVFYKHKNISTEDADIYFGITPWLDQDKLVRMYKPLMQYLTEQTGLKFDICVSPTYDQLLEDLKDGSIDFASFSPAIMAKAIQLYKDQMYLISTYISEGKDHYYGYIVTLKDKPYKSIKDIKNKRFAFVSEGSASGYKYPISIFLKMGINPFKYFETIRFSGSHNNIFKDLKEGVIDAGASCDDVYYPSQKKYGNIFKYIKQTNPIPLDGIVASKKSSKINVKLVRKIKKILKNTNSKTRTKSGDLVMDKELEFPFDGFAFRNFSFYNVVIETKNLVDKFEKNGK
jgi:phosphonate transport system substrate-binding protein